MEINDETTKILDTLLKYKDLFATTNNNTYDNRVYINFPNSDDINSGNIRQNTDVNIQGENNIINTPDDVILDDDISYSEYCNNICNELNILMEDLQNQLDNTYDNQLYPNSNTSPVLTLTDLNANTELLSSSSINICDEKCAICKEVYDDRNSIVRKINNCEHIFHQQCLDKWLESNGTCPICIQNVKNSL